MRKTMDSARRENLERLIAKEGGPAALARKLGHSGPSYLSQILSRHRPLTEKTVRAIEKALNLPSGWMDNTQSSQLDADLLTEVATRVLRQLGTRPKVSGYQQAKIIALVYERAPQEGRVDEAYITNLANLAVDSAAEPS